ncbi:MAG: hypothetical protein J6C33_06140 [Lachnospiraceae bacterium]|nr:hypothetical protein [Lachnospiraceae bacterium]
MNAYEEILGVMRNEGRKDNTAPIQIGTMTGAASCRIGRLELADSDLLIAEHLKTGYYGRDIFIEPLNSGDKVAVYRLSDELYIILERLV